MCCRPAFCAKSVEDQESIRDPIECPKPRLSMTESDSSLAASLDEMDKSLLNVAQAEFPLVSRPYAALGEKIGLGEQEVLTRFAELKAKGIIRQTSAIFDTRALGYKSTLVAMKFDPAVLDAGAAVVSEHPGVSHNYKREHVYNLSLIHISEPTRQAEISYAVFC